jgi:hypothetical protein
MNTFLVVAVSWSRADYRSPVLRKNSIVASNPSQPLDRLLRRLTSRDRCLTETGRNRGTPASGRGKSWLIWPLSDLASWAGTKCNITSISPLRRAVGKSFELASQNRGNVTLLVFCYLHSILYFQWLERLGGTSVHILKLYHVIHIIRFRDDRLLRRSVVENLPAWIN